MRTIWIASALALFGVNARGADDPTFEGHVWPILKAYCYECHGEGEKLKGDLDVRLRRTLVEGGKNGAAVVPGKPDESAIVTRARLGEMPPGKKKLDAAAIDTLARWVAAGAKTARAEPESLAAGMPITAEDRAWWSFQPIQRRTPPAAQPSERARTPVDAWLLAPLRAKGFGFNADADKLTLIRRATFDLTGLPPTLDEISAFVKDASPDAYEKLIDRLLASSAYGERWGRHWLDVAGYADSEGFDQADPIRTTAWKYRDYVIASLNADKPFNQFVREQIAGDELVKQPFTDLTAQDREKLAATGFLRMAPDGSGNPGADQQIARNQVLADTIQIVTSSLLGMTVTCARCHDHRYDPIPQTDFYRLRAVLEPAFDPTAWKPPGSRQLSLYTAADRAAAAACESRAKTLDAARVKKQDEFIAATLEKEYAKLPEADRAKAREAKKVPAAIRSAEQKALMAKYPSLNVNSGSLYLYDNKAAEELKKMAAAATAERAKKPPEEFLRAMIEVPGRVPPTRLQQRGDPDQPKQVVAPGALTILDGVLPYVVRKTEGLATSGRRLALANWLVDPKNPLVARVFVNRVWMHHFGRGLVITPGDFGRLGQRPTHPELLDWLATEFVANGWSQKKLHKLLMTSTAYRQSSERITAKDTADPDNRLLGRFALRRLDAESLRDAMLATSGKLNRKAGGPPLPVMEDDVGQAVLGMANRDGAGYKLGDESLAPDEANRRSIYVQVRRSRPLAVLDAFDWAVVEPNCEARNSSTVAPQSLFLLNNGFVLAQADAFARRVIADAGADRKAQVVRAWTLAYGAPPTDSEAERAVAFVNELAAEFAKHPTVIRSGGESKAPTKVKGKPAPAPVEPVDAALAAFCQTLLAGNRYLYVD